MTRGRNVLRRVVLAVTGVTLVAVGGGVALVPQAFYGGYGITLADGAQLLGELRASGLALLLLGALVGTGALVGRLAPTSALVGTVTMLAHAAGRLLSWIADGGLAPGLVAAGVAELVLGTACLWVLRPRRERSADE
ncbi:DUF4345 family protein [Promicromonospora sp. NFX87]|uniref:DUF4345 family protein n=1 Tax=Promicromonospora sp. NFX87 TaxID=3402691 RepID=UPI003AFA3E97